LKNLPLLAAVAIAFTACNPTTYKVKRETTIDAPADVVFAQVNNHLNRDAWWPWEAKDPDMEKTYEGPEAGVGAKYSWVGNEEVGTGWIEILESEPNKRIKSKFVFTEPRQSESIIYWNFEPLGNSTRVTWTAEGEVPGYLFWIGPEDIEEAMGPDFESGLARLKEVSEKTAEVAKAYEVIVKEVKSKPYYYISDRIAMSQMSSEFFGARFGKIMNFLGDDAAKVSEPPFAVFHKWDEASGQTEVSVAIAATTDKPTNGEIKRGMTFEGTTMMVSYRGPYEGTGDVHNFLHEHIAISDYDFAGAPWEVYVTDPADEPDPANWITEVYYPVTPRSTVQ